MNWGKKYIYVSNYKFTSTNQHGDRFKRIGSKQISVATLETDCTNIPDMKTLILLSDALNIPVHYDFGSEPQVAFIEVVAKEAIND